VYKFLSLDSHEFAGDLFLTFLLFSAHNRIIGLRTKFPALSASCPEGQRPKHSQPHFCHLSHGRATQTNQPSNTKSTQGCGGDWILQLAQDTQNQQRRPKRKSKEDPLLIGQFYNLTFVQKLPVFFK
jgi:hypothetical protein